MKKQSRGSYEISFADLIDHLTIDQIKEVLRPRDRKSFGEEMNRICRDIDALITHKKVKLSARFIRVVIALAQFNLHIWHTKETMMKEKNAFESSMKLAHQLNGIRNQLKNILLEESGFADKSGQRTNIGTDNLNAWHVSL